MMKNSDLLNYFFKMIIMISGQFNIENDEYSGDFDLNITMNSGQTSQPPWTYRITDRK